MPESKLGRTLVIANPASQSGAGAEGAQFIERTLQHFDSATDGYQIRLTNAPGHATSLARSATHYDTVLALGGDGVIHEVVNGLMKIGPNLRPRLGIIPLGSGNDFARSLGMAQNTPEKSLAQVLQGVTRKIDLGLVNGIYFDQTLSFGVDAAIALDTMERRQKSGSHGTRLFAASGIDVIRHQLRRYAYAAKTDGERLDGESVIFAIQNGPTYGGGFKICPKADLSDGKLDVCSTVGNPSMVEALLILGRARFGAHVNSRYMRFRHIKQLTIDFEDEPPCQADGERVEGSHFEVSCVHRALDVIFPTYQM